MEQWHQFTGRGKSILHHARVGQLGELLDADAGMAQHLNGRPGPEGPMFFQSQVAPFSAIGVLGPDVGDVGPNSGRAPEREPARGEERTRLGGPCGDETLRRPRPTGIDRFDEGGQYRQAFPGPLIHPRLAADGVSPVGDLARFDRTRDGPRPPPRRILGRPLGDIKVETPNRRQAVGRTLPGAAHLFDAAVRSGAAGRLGEDPPFPRRRDRRYEPQRGDARLMRLQVAPEQSTERVCQADHADVVKGDLTLQQVVDEQVAHLAGSVVRTG